MQNVIVVAINYRLGFAALNSTMNSTSFVSSNNALRDQVEALNWVRRYISAFGGQPNEIMIYGESAGAQCVAAQLTSPLLKQGPQHSDVQWWCGCSVDGDDIKGCLS